MSDGSGRSAVAGRSPIVAGVILGAAVGVFAISFGVLAVAAGLTVAQTCAMSLLVFTGASQYAAVGVVASGGSPLAAIGSALLLAARNGVYGLAMAREIKGSLLKRVVASHFVLDESTALSLGQEDPADREKAFWAAGLAVFVFWNIGTLVGAIGGSAVGDPSRYGLDAAFPAGFVALVGAHLRRENGILAGLLGAGAALILVPLTPAGVPILVAALAALVGLRGGRGKTVT